MGMVGSLCAVKAEAFQLESAGVRVGVSPSPGAAHHFRQAEGFVNWNLPWRWDLGADWWLQTRLDASAGWLGSSFEDGFIGTLGPSVLFRQNHLPFSLSVGVSPTFLSQVPSSSIGTSAKWCSLPVTSDSIMIFSNTFGQVIAFNICPMPI